METLWVGIDIGKANMVVALAQGDETLELGELSNDSCGFSTLAELLEEAEARPEEIHVVVEPTGGYELTLVAFAYAQGWRVSLPNPKQVRDWARGDGQRAKTDRQDAQMLARFGASKRPAPQTPLAIEVSELDSLLKRRHDLEQMRQQELNRLQEMQERPGIASAVLKNLQRVIDALEEALQEVEDEIEEHLRQHAHLQQDMKRLLSLPGVGEKIVLPLLVILYRWQTLTAGEGTAKGLTAFVGLDPQPHESGRSVRKRASISKMGNHEMRRLLYMGALSAVHGHNPLYSFYRRLVGRGKAKKLAVVAAARKILTWAWTIFSRQTEWDPAFHAN